MIQLPLDQIFWRVTSLVFVAIVSLSVLLFRGVEIQPPVVAAIVSAISSIGAVLVTGFVAYQGYRFTSNASAQAGQRTIEHNTRLKVADFRLDWMEGLRKDVAAYIKLRSERAALRERLAEADDPELKKDYERQRFVLFVQQHELRSLILLRLKPDSDNEDERQLERRLLKATPRDSSAARADRKEIRELTRRILKAEWKRVKIEIGLS